MVAIIMLSMIILGACLPRHSIGTTKPSNPSSQYIAPSVYEYEKWEAEANQAFKNYPEFRISDPMKMKKFLGLYGDCFVGVFEYVIGHFAGVPIEYKHHIGGFEFLLKTNLRLFAYVGGQMYILEDAYHAGFITYDDLMTIANLYRHNEEIPERYYGKYKGTEITFEVGDGTDRKAIVQGYEFVIKGGGKIVVNYNNEQYDLFGFDNILSEQDICNILMLNQYYNRFFEEKKAKEEQKNYANSIAKQFAEYYSGFDLSNYSEQSIRYMNWIVEGYKSTIKGSATKEIADKRFATAKKLLSVVPTKGEKIEEAVMQKYIETYLKDFPDASVDKVKIIKYWALIMGRMSQNFMMTMGNIKK